MNDIPIKFSGYHHTYTLRVDFKVKVFSDLLKELAPSTALLNEPFLQSVEDCPPVGLTPVYAALLDHHRRPIGFYCFQIKFFKAQESIKLGQDEDFFCRLHLRLKTLVATLVEFNTLVCGNLLLSGPYGFYISSDYFDQRGLIYQHVIEEMQGWLKSNSRDTNVILVKDCFEDGRILSGSTYHSFEIQPNMILDIANHWKCFDDYMEDLLSKYRVRAKRARKAASGIVVKEITESEVQSCQDAMYRLYKQTATHAEFNLIDLHPNYFYTLKKNLKDTFHVYTYSLNGELIAFYTVIEDGDVDEAHFLGINESLNKPHQVYLNILFDILNYAILRQQKQIRFSRTALEIKSSVGAKPHTLTCYIKHRNVMNNTFVPYLLEFLNEKKEWLPRHPFKTLELSAVALQKD